MQGERDTVHTAPEDEAQASSVPQSAEEHGDQEVEISAQATSTTPPERYVEVVSQPGGEGDVPASPELGDGGGAVGRVEVDIEAEAEPEGYTDSHIGVAREVAVDLEGVAVDGHKVFEATVEGGGIEDTVHEVERDIVGDDRLLDEPREDQEEPLAKLLLGNSYRSIDLRYKVFGTYDRSRHELGKEGDVKEVVHPASQRAYLASVDVDDVAERLEGEEGDTDGEEDI